MLVKVPCYITYVAIVVHRRQISSLSNQWRHDDDDEEEEEEVVTHCYVMDRTNYFLYFRRRYHRMRVFTYQGIPGPKPGFLFGTDMYDEVLKVWQLAILPKESYLPCVSMAGRALLAGYNRIIVDHMHDVPLRSPIYPPCLFFSLVKSCDYLVPSELS